MLFVMFLVCSVYIMPIMNILYRTYTHIYVHHIYNSQFINGNKLSLQFYMHVNTILQCAYGVNSL